MSTIPQGYVLYKGEWCHPSRVPKGNGINEMVARAKAELPMIQEPKPRKRIRQSSKPELNKLEKEFQCYVEEHTDLCLISQSFRFKLGNGIWYKPDFVCFEPMVCYEIKGPHSFRGGFENLKVAASKYPQFTWKLMWKEGNQWEEQIVLP